MIQYWVRPKPKAKRKSPDKKGFKTILVSPKKNLGVFLKNFNFVEVKRSFFLNIRSRRKVGRLFAGVEILEEQTSLVETWIKFPRGTRLFNGDVDKFSRNKLP